MKKILFGYKEVFIVLACLLAVKAMSIASGYFLDPAYFGFLFTPLIVIGLAVTALIFTLIPVFKLFEKQSRNKESIISIFLCLILWLFQYMPLVPGGLDGAQLRLKKYSEEDYREIFILVDDMYRKYSGDRKFFSPGHDGYKEFIGELKNNHRIFNISSFPVDVFRRESHVAIEWGSGLTGGYEVIIFENDESRRWPGNDKPVYLYDTVALHYKN
ncbi:MAG TPA: hypothetical protein VF268_07490 [Gammaproteobacteria bacterium]